MPFLLIVYGAAFVAGGFALMIQTRAAGDTQPLPRIALALLAGFALVHGAGEWVSMAVVVELRREGQASNGLVIAGLLLLALSFALLFAFGSALLVRQDYRVVHVIAGGLVPLALCAVLVLRFTRTGAVPETVNRESIEAIVRYVLGIPACLSAAFGLFTIRRSVPAEETRTLQYIVLAAGVFLSYGVLAGIVVPRAPFVPASLLNASAFEENVHVPVEVLRALCAIAIVWLLSEAFIIEPFRRLRREVAHVRSDVRTLLASDLREPLNAIQQGTTALAGLSPVDRGSERERAIVQRVRDGVQLVRERIADLLDLSQLHGGELELTAQAIDLCPVLIRAAEQEAASRAGARVTVDCPEKIPSVFADPDRLERVVRMLLSNARAGAMANGEIRIRAAQDGDAVIVSVTSAGSVIPASRLPYVFSRDRRHGAESAPSLALHLARGLVEAMGGQISVDSLPDGHVTFRFSLPVARSTHPQLTVARHTD